MTWPQEQGHISRTKGCRHLKLSANLTKSWTCNYSKNQASSFKHVSYSKIKLPVGWHPPPLHVRASVKIFVFITWYFLNTFSVEIMQVLKYAFCIKASKKINERNWTTNVSSVYIHVIFFSVPISYHLLVLDTIETRYLLNKCWIFLALEGFQGTV